MFEVIETKETMAATEEDVAKMSYGDYIDYLYSTGGFEVPAAPIVNNLKDYLAHIFEYMPQDSAEHQMALNFIGVKMRAARKNEYIAAYPRELIDEFVSRLKDPNVSVDKFKPDENDIEWVERADVEYREDWVQLIVSAAPKIVDLSSNYNGAFLMFLEDEPDDVMFGETSFIGGHVRYQDSSLRSETFHRLLATNVVRELYEEMVGIEDVSAEMVGNISLAFNENADYGNISRYHIGHVCPIELKYSNVADVVPEPGKKLIMYMDFDDTDGTLPKVGHFEKTKNIPIYYRNTIHEINPDVWVLEYFKLKG